MQVKCTETPPSGTGAQALLPLTSPTKAHMHMPTIPTTHPTPACLPLGLSQHGTPIPVIAVTVTLLHMCTQGQGIRGPSPGYTWKKPGVMGPAAITSLGAMLPITGLGAAAALCRGEGEERTGSGHFLPHCPLLFAGSQSHRTGNTGHLILYPHMGGYLESPLSDRAALPHRIPTSI